MRRPELLIVSGEQAGRRVVVGEGGVRLGRSSSNDIPIADEQLSRNHCLFETVGEADIRVTDLASANGTLVNGEPLGDSPVVLRPGDLIEVGATSIRVEGEPPPAGAVDLGLGGQAPSGTPPARRRSPLANVLWGVAVLTALAAIAVVLLAPSDSAVETPAAVAEDAPSVREFVYEKVAATLEGIFRYELSVAADGMIRVVLDDTRENRHPTIAPHPLDDRARAELNEILAYEALRGVDREYVGPEPDPPALNSWRLKVVYSSRVRTIRIVNTQEPEAFRAVRERLEAFANNELGLHAIQYSRDRLVAMAEEQIAVGRAKWEDREVQHGNLAGAVAAYREALFYLETVDPKPPCVQAARQGLEMARAELDRRYGEQRFAIDRALNLGDWETARRELMVLLELVPDRKDDRNREASVKLMDVEKRLKGGK
ncbi:MAG: FHA domain-containing protein [Kiritimatiellia bacterium]